MKKNISINLCGRLYNIDEDAYELLKNYTDSLRSYFGRQKDGEEIVNDIEERIAELLDELKQQGTEAITIDHIQAIVERVGKPDEMEAGNSSEDKRDSDPDEEKKNIWSDLRANASKRLYRNPNDKKVSGVLAGLAAYCGVDTLWMRMGFAALMVFLWTFDFWHAFWTVILAYVALAVLMPVAETPEDRLRMKGHKVTPENLGREVCAEAGRQYAERQPETSGARGFFSTLFTVIATLIRWTIYATCIAIVVGCLAAIVSLCLFYINPQLFGPFTHVVNIQEAMAHVQTSWLVMTITAAAALFLTLYCIVHALLSEFGQLKPMSFGQRLVMLILWFTLLFTSLFSGTIVLGEMSKHAKFWHFQQHVGIWTEEAEEAEEMDDSLDSLKSLDIFENGLPDSVNINVADNHNNSVSIKVKKGKLE